MAGGELLRLRPHPVRPGRPDSYAATPDDPDRKVPNPAKKAAAQVRHAEVLAAAAEAQRDASLATMRNPAPGQPVTITNQMINALDAPAEAAWRELQAAQDTAAAIPTLEAPSGAPVIRFGEMRALPPGQARRPGLSWRPADLH